MESAKNRPELRDKKRPFSRQWGEIDMSPEDRREAFDRVIGALAPSLPTRIPSVPHDLELHASVLLLPGTYVESPSDLLPVLTMVRDQYDRAVILDEDSKQSAQTRAAFANVSDISKSLAAMLNDLSYEQFYILTSSRRAQGGPAVAHDEQSDLLDLLSYLGSETIPARGSACRLSGLLAQLSELTAQRGATLEQAIGKTNTARNHMASPRWQLIHDCWSICALLGIKPSSTPQGKFHDLVVNMHWWSIGLEEAGFEKDLRSYVKVRLEFDKASAALTRDFRDLNVQTPLNFVDFPDLRDRRSELVRAKRALGAVRVEMINQHLDAYFSLRAKLELGVRAAELDVKAGRIPSAGIKRGRRRKSPDVEKSLKTDVGPRGKD